MAPENKQRHTLESEDGLFREVCGGGYNPHGYWWRARIETRIKRGRSQYRFVGEQKFDSWRDSGPGFDGKRSRWFKTIEEAASAANGWLDGKTYDPRSEAVGYV